MTVCRRETQNRTLQARTFRATLQTEETLVGLFTKRSNVAADGYERQSVRGYIDKGKVAKLLGEGWEIEHTQQVEVRGTTFKQAVFLLKRKAG